MRILKFIPLAVIVAGLVAFSVVGGADAARGGVKGKPGGNDGGGGGGNKTEQTSASLSVSPSSVSSGDYYYISGSGFKANEQVFLAFHEPFCCASRSTWADSDGKISNLPRQAGASGTYTINAYQYSGSKLVLMATVSFVVSP